MAEQPPTPPRPTTALPDAATLLRRFRRRAKKSLGQHFLLEPRALERIAAEAERGSPPQLVEIGPGAGALTQALLRTGRPVLAIEKDREAVAFLQAALAPLAPLTLHEGDALELDLPDDARNWNIVGNLPYNVATQIFFRCVDLRQHIGRMVFMFQREVAQRFVAQPDSKAHGILSLVADFHFHTELVLTLGPGAFVPPPKVDSAVVTFVPRPPALPLELEPDFRAVVRQAFSQRRKTLSNTLTGLWGLDKERVTQTLESVELRPSARAESLDLAAFCRLTLALRAAVGRT